MSVNRGSLGGQEVERDLPLAAVCGFYTLHKSGPFILCAVLVTVLHPQSVAAVFLPDGVEARACGAVLDIPDQRDARICAKPRSVLIAVHQH